MSSSILHTLIYFDMFNTPLTREEIFHWIWSEKIEKQTDLVAQLDQLEQQGKISKKNGFYYLPGRENTINTRQSAAVLIEKKMQIAKRAGKIIRFIPFTQALFVCNTVAGGGVKKESDIDVLIVVKNKRIWITRLLTTLIFSIFRLRRNKTKITDRICLSFYITDDNLDFSKIKIEDPDIYLIYWLENLIPVYDPQNFLQKIKHQNQWIKKNIPNSGKKYQTLHRWKTEDSRLSRLCKIFFEKSWNGNYGDMIEAQAKELQQAKMKKNQPNHNNNNKLGVMITDQMLKFHENDRREQYKNDWIKKINDEYAKT